MIADALKLVPASLTKHSGNNRMVLAYVLALISLCAVFLIPPDFAFSELEAHILLQLKLPVLLTAVMVGLAIGAASACLQVLLNNPLADPGIIGISSGASLMAAAFILLAGTPFGLAIGLDSLTAYSINVLPLLCFVGAFGSSLLIFILARAMGGAVSAVILAGIAISTACSAVIAWMFLVAPPSQLQSLTFWLMGSFNNTTWGSLSIAIPVVTICLCGVMLNARRLNLLYLGEQNAALAGLDTRRFQTWSLVAVALLVGVSVSLAGSIAFLGLLVPHFVRRVHGNNNALVLPLSAILGACVMVLCALVNTHLTTMTLPISMLTASIGAPLFIYVMIKGAPKFQS
ncbi:FecCD family ABC transporter permease [Glaciecola siphonariae]|uniref:FecCD family ABC transporter permease n=1 Tax=Glaciecola siphonariae TaxID=521012 RepID=A0ABV9LTJ7_9ALTE